MVQPGYKECPVCFEEIKEKALVCRFCGAVLTEQELPVRILSREEKEGVDRALAVETPPAETLSETEQSVVEVMRRRRSFINMGDVESVIAARYKGIDPAFAVKHRQRLEEFLSRSEDEYRTASVLFIDITGYTALSEKMSPEAVKDVLDTFYEICTQVISRYNGFVVKYAGDATLAVFGAPVAYDRDVESAVYAALEIREMVRLFPRIEGTRIQVSAGIATGRILSSITRKGGGQIDFDIFGPSVNLSARIEAAAEADTLLICPDTYEQISRVFDARKKRARKFKNIAEPVVTYEVEGPKEAQEVERRDYSMPFMGRRHELERLTECWRHFEEEARTGNFTHAHGCVVVGMPGIGKTRLLTQFRETVIPDVQVLASEGSPHNAKLSYGEWRTALSSRWGGGPNDETDKQDAGLNQWIESLGESGYELAEKSDGLLSIRAIFGIPAALQKLKDLSKGIVRRQICADIAAILETLARNRPLVILLDDLQWADESSLEILDSLLTAPPIRNVFFLLAHRNGFVLPGENCRRLQRIVLRELDADSGRDLLKHLADTRDLVPEVSQGLLKYSSGNPLFLVELVHSIAHRIAQMEEKPEGEALTEMIRTWVPPSLKGMLESRIDLLDRRRKLVLQCAAVLGQRFAFQLIELFDIVRDGLLARLYSLKGLEFLDDLKTPRELEFLFHHHMIREIAYQSLLERQRSDLHDLIAARIEVTFKNRLEDLYPVLAFHYEQANNREQAIRYLQLAGDRAVEQAALPEAIHFYESALERLEKGAAGDNRPSEEEQKKMGQILWTKGRLHRLLGQYEDALGVFRKGSALPFVEKDRLMRARFRLEFGMTHMQTGAYAEARKAAQEAQPVLKEFEDLRGLAAAANVLGYCAWGEGQWAEAREAWNETARLAGQVSDLASQADAGNNLALLDWKTGKLTEALAGFHKNLRLQHKTWSRFGVAATLMNMGIIEENLGKLTDAEAHYLQALEIAERLRYPQVQTWIYGNLANLGLVRGQYPQAVEHGAKSLQLAASIGDLRSQAIAHENLALGYLYLCQPDERDKNLRQGRTIARKIGDRERLFSLDLVEIEAALEDHKDNCRDQSLVRVKKKLAGASEALENGGFRLEVPRLKRLEARFYLLKGHRPEALEAIEKGIEESARQQNRVEEKRLQELCAAVKE